MLKSIFKDKNIFTREERNILSASSIMMFLILVTKAIGLVTKTVIASQLGTKKYGLFIAANTLPEILSTLLIFGTITSVIIPILVDVIQQKGQDSFETVFNSIANFGIISFIIFAILVALGSNIITPFVIERLAKPIEPFSQEEISQIAAMMRWLLLPQIILGISTMITSALNAFKRFIIPQLAPLFYNLGVLIGTIFLIPLLDGSPWGITWGVLIGSILHLLIQIPLASHLKIKYRFIIAFTNKKLRETLTIGLPRIIALASDQIAIAIDRIIAIGLGAAPLGAYHLAVSLVSIPFSLFTNTFSIAALPHLSQEFSKGNIDKFKEIFTKVFNQILFLTTPIAMILLVLRLPLVRLFYGILGREFTWENTLMVSWVVFFFSLGLIPEVLQVYLNRAFYAIHDTVRPLIVGTFVVIGGITTGIFFTNYFSNFNIFSLKEITWNPTYFLSKSNGIAAVGGLALSSSIIYSSAFFILLILLSRKIKGLDIRKFWLTSIKKILFGLIMAIFMYILFKVWDQVLDTARTINLFILTISTIIPGLCIYVWLAYVFSDPEISMVSKLLNIIKRYLIIFKNKIIILPS